MNEFLPCPYAVFYRETEGQHEIKHLSGQPTPVPPFSRASIFRPSIRTYMHAYIHTKIHTYLPTYRPTYTPTYLPNQCNPLEKKYIYIYRDLSIYLLYFYKCMLLRMCFSLFYLVTMYIYICISIYEYVYVKEIIYIYMYI